MPQETRSFRLDYKTITPGDAWMLGLIVFTFGPFLMATAAKGIAYFLGEPLNPANVPDVPFIGGLLHLTLMLAMLWSMTVAPIGFLILLVAFPLWIISKLVNHFRRGRNQSEQEASCQNNENHTAR